MVKDFMKREWKFLLIFIVLIISLGIGYYEYKKYQTIPMLDITGSSDEYSCATVPAFR